MKYYQGGALRSPIVQETDRPRLVSDLRGPKISRQFFNPQLISVATDQLAFSRGHMALTIKEFFGFSPTDEAGKDYAKEKKCPFLPGSDPADLGTYGKCIKPKHGACSLSQATSGSPVIACPNRLYAKDFEVLHRVATVAFGPNIALFRKTEIDELKKADALDGNEVAVFGKHWGNELSIPQNTIEDNDGVGGFFIDYILARLDREGNIADFTAVEIQTIDTTGSYKDQAESYFVYHDAELAPPEAPDLEEARQAEAKAAAAAERASQQIDEEKVDDPGVAGAPEASDADEDHQLVQPSKAGFNWANVSKRILPQLIYKGHVLRREKLCTKGLFFVCPSAVLKKVKARLGTKLLDYPIASGTITLLAYDLSNEPNPGEHRRLVAGETITTTVEQIAYAFVSPVNLPGMGVYETAINAALAKKGKGLSKTTQQRV
jgi:hypothetical protein